MCPLCHVRSTNPHLNHFTHMQVVSCLIRYITKQLPTEHTQNFKELCLWYDTNHHLITMIQNFQNKPAGGVANLVVRVPWYSRIFCLTLFTWLYVSYFSAFYYAFKSTIRLDFSVKVPVQINFTIPYCKKKSNCNVSSFLFLVLLLPSLPALHSSHSPILLLLLEWGMCVS